MRAILTISKREITRLRTRFTGKSRFLVIGVMILAGILSSVMYHQDLSISKDLYTIGVSPDGPSITDSRFTVMTLDYEAGYAMVQDGSIDAFVQPDQVIYNGFERSQYAAGALKKYLENQELIRISNEYDIDKAFPLRIEVRHIPVDRHDDNTDERISFADILEVPEEADEPSANVNPPEPHASETDAAVMMQLEDFDGEGNLPKFKAEFISDKEIIIPSLLTPPIPLAQVLLAFFYIVPIFFVSVFFTSSFMEEKMNRKLVILMSSPITPFQIILGKMLPYVGYSIFAIIAITLVLHGNVLIALAIFIPIMLFILSLYLMVALLYRTFKDQTFFSVLAVWIITAYLVTPAMFAGVSDLSYVSPLTLAVNMYRGESIGVMEYLLSTISMYLVFCLVMFLGTRMFNEEYLMGFRPLHTKLSEALYLAMNKCHLNISVFAVSLILVPLVFMVQLTSIVMASNLPSALAFGALFLIAIIAEEVAKSAGTIALLQNRAISSPRQIIVLSLMSALGFLLGEKLLLFLALSVVSESMFTDVIFSGGLLVLPLIMHFVATACVCLISAKLGTKYYPLAILAGGAIHTVYNLSILAGLLS